MNTSAQNTPATTLDYSAAHTTIRELDTLPEEDRQAIAAWSHTTIDYVFWYRKTFEAIVAEYRADPAYANGDADAEHDDSILDEFAEGDEGVYGSALAALAWPLIGKGVHKAQLRLLASPYAVWESAKDVADI